MRYLGRIGLFVRTIKKFLHNLKRQCPGSSGFGKLEKELSERKSWGSFREKYWRTPLTEVTTITRKPKRKGSD